jgi:hypothetical protein
MQTSPSFRGQGGDRRRIPFDIRPRHYADLDRVRDAWSKCQRRRRRDAIYGYLNAVYELVAWWTAEGHEVQRAYRALWLRWLPISEREDPFAAVIRCTADPAWSRLMRYAAVYKPDSEPLGQFVKRKGGINDCAARFSRRLGTLARNQA